MVHRGMALLVVATVIVIFDATLAIANTNLTASQNPVVYSTHEVDMTNTTNRRLATNGDGKDEERVVSGVKKLTPEKINGWLNKNKPVDEVFTKLMLPQRGEDLVRNRRFLTWVKYVDDFNRKHPQQATSMAPTLAAKYNENTLLQILQAARQSESTSGIATKLEAELIQWSMAVGKSPTTVFKFFTHHYVDKLLQIPQFLTWLKYVDDFNLKHPQQTTSIPVVIASHYLFSGVLIFLKAARKSENTKSIATRFESEAIKRSMTDGLSPTNVFKLFAPEKITEGLLQMPQFVSWLKYVDEFKVKHPGNDAAAILAMVNRYGDTALFKMLEAAMKISSMKDIATKLEGELWNSWRITKKNKKKPYEVFLALELNKTGEKLFSNPNFSTWVNYLNMYNKENPGSKERMITSVFHNYRNDFWSITKMTMNDVDEGTVKIAKQLQAEQFDDWLRRKEPPKFVFAELHLSDDANLFSNANIRIWMKYLDVFNKRYPEMKTNTIATLLYHYSDEEVAQILAAARKNPWTEKIATNLQMALVNTWVRDLKDPTEVSKLLKVDMSDGLMQTYLKKFKWAMSSTGDKLFDRPHLETYLKYVEFYKAKHPGEVKSTVAILTSRYGDEALAKVIAESKRISKWKEMAQNLEAEQLQNWLSTGKSSEEVFRLLKLDQTGENMLENVLYPTWATFAKKLLPKQRRPEKVYSIDTLMGIYTEEQLLAILVAGNKRPSLKMKAMSYWDKLRRKWIDVDRC
ncbi:Putative RxLR effector [Phytophthora palmivora]|uniref:RxLR effector n=1 Tax=Phytophthora palmivora TaxID=4796 RepID=A0A2P4WXZ8_9STRA|nr:Putative RxLR effector [Phytophthora palmivora]